MSFNLALLSKYRTQLMGFAMIWIVYFHMTINIPISILSSIKQIGYGGVDIFLFTSGIGILYSWKKNKNITDFYKKRVLRILPSFIFIISFFGLIAFIDSQYSISTLLYSITSFVVATAICTNLDYWFIPFIIYLYIITPWYLKLFEQNIGIATIIVTVIWVLYICIQARLNLPCHTLLISRIPIYFIGIYAGTLLKKEIRLNLKQIVLGYIIMLVGFMLLFYFFQSFQFAYLWAHGLLWLPFILITPPLCMLLTQLFGLFPNYKFPILTFWGKYSLTIYLLHVNTLNILSENMGISKLTNILAIIITLIGSYLIQNGITILMDRVFKKEVNI